MRFPTYFISHGGGPWSYVTGELRQMHAQLEACLGDIPCQLGEFPTAVLMISGHWVENDFTVMAAANPPMIYDYSGFPPETYTVKYSAPGSPDLARRVQRLVADAGYRCDLDPARGFDHGAFVPLSVMYPKANVVVFQLSLRADYDPAAHLAVGGALATLRNEGILIIGSGLSYHNMRRFSQFLTRPDREQGGVQASHEFDRWLNSTLAESDPDERSRSIRTA